MEFKEEVMHVLVKAFSCLSLEHKSNLLWHVENLTPICCGEMYAAFIDGNGGADPAQLALSREVPIGKDVSRSKEYDELARKLDECIWPEHEGDDEHKTISFCDALLCATEQKVRAAIIRSCS